MSNTGSGTRSELSRSDGGYQALVDNATIGIFRTHRRGRFTAVNPALVEMLGYAASDEVLTLDLDHDVFADVEQRARLIEQFGDNGRVTGVEVVWKRANGGEVTVLLSGRMIKSAAGDVVGFEGTALDLSERRTLERQLQQSQKMDAIGQLTGGIAHDFNNLLTVILGNVEQLAEATAPDNPHRAQLADVVRAAHRGRSLVRKLLQFGRELPLQRRPLNLADLVDELCRVLVRVIPETITVDIRLDRDATAVRADAAAVEQILLNLATNARDAMPDGGRLSIAMARTYLPHGLPDRPWVQPGEYVCMLVSDTGAGIDAATQVRMFEPFFTTKPPGKGSGLGLAMIYGLVQQHGGFVTVQSTPGEGTSIEVCFPVADEDADVEPPEDVHVPAGGSETILIAEDEAAIRRVSRRLLTNAGYTVLEATDGIEALELYRAHHASIGLIVSDMVMPRLCGRRLYDALHRVNPEVAVLFVSGYTAAHSTECEELAADVAFLQKPWTVDEMLTAVRDALDTRPSPSGSAG